MIIIIAIATIIVIACLIKFFIGSTIINSLKGKHVVVTGGSSGIGKNVAIEVVNMGAHVTILARNDIKLKKAIEEISKYRICDTQNIEYRCLDVINYDKVIETLLELDNNKPIFMLVNCAGMAICGKIEDLPITDFQHLMNLNYFGTVNAIKAVIPKMKSRNEGIIVLTASQAAFLGIYGMTAYSATKYALRGLAEALDMELQPYNISVTLSLPPDTDTPGLKTENENKPLITALISDSGGLFQPYDVAKQLVKDALNRQFYSTIGFESNLMRILCCGMTPFHSIIDLFTQILFMGLCRLMTAFYLWKFHKIIKENDSKVTQ